MKKRYYIYASLIGLIVVQFVLTPVLPVIQLPGEILWKWPGGQEFIGSAFGGGFTNTFLGALLTFVIIVEACGLNHALVMKFPQASTISLR